MLPRWGIAMLNSSIPLKLTAMGEGRGPVFSSQ